MPPPPPGRIFIVRPSHTFAQLAEAIDAAFARWDLSHLHEFELPGGRRVGLSETLSVRPRGENSIQGGAG